MPTDSRPADPSDDDPNGGPAPFQMGRLRPVARGLRLSLGNYLARTLPKPPPVIDWGAGPAAPGLSQLFANDKLGDCTAAGAFHIAGVMDANAGNPSVFQDQDVINFYSATTGYKQGDPTSDLGANEVPVLNYWMEKGLMDGKHKIDGWMAVNGNDPVEVRTAIFLFGNLYFGCELPDDWVRPYPSASGFLWDVAGPPNPRHGHCFIACGYEPGRVKIATWGLTGWISDAAISAYATPKGQGELYCVISADGVNAATQMAPNGFFWTALAADFDSMKNA